MKTVIVTGGRDYLNYNMVNDVLSFIKPERVVQGGASGADTLALEWAIKNKVGVLTYKANWKTYGKSAGPKRNAAMLNDYPKSIVLAFPGGAGTANCIKQANERKMIVLAII